MGVGTTMGVRNNARAGKDMGGVLVYTPSKTVEFAKWFTVYAKV